MKICRFCLPIALFCIAFAATSCQKENEEPDRTFAFDQQDNAFVSDTGSKAESDDATIDLSKHLPQTGPDDSGGTKLNGDDAIRDDYRGFAPPPANN